MDPVVARPAERRNLDTFLAPLVRTHHAREFTQRDRAVRAVPGRPGVGIPGFGAGVPEVRRPAQRHGVVGRQRNDQHAQHPGPLRLRLAVQVKRLCRGGWCRGLGTGTGGGRAGGPARLAIRPAGQRLQQLAGIVKVAAPQQGRALAGQTVGGVGAHRVVGQHHAPWRRGTTFRTPAHRLLDAVFEPVELRGRVHPPIVRQAPPASGQAVPSANGWRWPGRCSGAARQRPAPPRGSGHAGSSATA
jgi:hypothetical protein